MLRAFCFNIEYEGQYPEAIRCTGLPELNWMGNSIRAGPRKSSPGHNKSLITPAGYYASEEAIPGRATAACTGRTRRAGEVKCRTYFTLSLAG